MITAPPPTKGSNDGDDGGVFDTIDEPCDEATWWRVFVEGDNEHDDREERCASNVVATTESRLEVASDADDAESCPILECTGELDSLWCERGKGLPSRLPLSS